jgi:hypothetical protein
MRGQRAPADDMSDSVLLLFSATSLSRPMPSSETLFVAFLTNNLPLIGDE